MKSECTVMKASERSGKFDDGNSWRQVKLQLSEKPGSDRFDGEFQLSLEQDQVELVLNPAAFEGQQVVVALTGHRVWKTNVEFQGRVVSSLPQSVRQPAGLPPLVPSK